ncbi:MAG: cysteine synthase A [Myxococcaceae bacterium]
MNLPNGSTPLDGMTAAIGNTPLIRLRRVSNLTRCEIYGKAEFLNPGGSVKDRAALAIVLDAERRGLIQPGGVIVEGTAGNTGIGLALVGNARGYRTVIVIPETQSQEKKDMLRLAGVTLYEVPAVPYKNPNNYVHIAQRVAEQLAKTESHGVVWAQQFDNVANREGHFATTGQEIWQQTDGRVDAFVCAIGTGGTLAGVAAALREKKPHVKIGLADPPGAAMHAYFTTGELKAEGTSITEGIGQARITRNVEGLRVDRSWQISDTETAQMVFDLAEHEGLVLGSSSGINVVGAVRMAQELGPGHVIVTVLCDSGTRYASRLFNAEFLRSKGLPVPAWIAKPTSTPPPGAFVHPPGAT